MTLKEIRESSRDTLNAADIAPVIGCNPQALRVIARQEPERLGFPCIVSGCRVRFPRVPFIKYMDGELPAVRGKAFRKIYPSVTRHADNEGEDRLPARAVRVMR